MIGKILDGRYRIIQVLGSGAFGQTYLAEDIRRPGNPQCVVKQLCPTNDRSISLQAANRLFKREAETLEKLGKHDKIPQLLAYFAEHQKFYLVKEFTPGHPLTKEIIAGQPLPEEEVINILVEVLEILVFVHSNRVIHRDIKPANLIRRNTDGKLVLIDFGSVKEISSQITQGQSAWTIATGTPAYMPVEQFQGNPQFNSDIYALGTIAIQALTGLPASELPKLQDPSTGKMLWRHRVHVRPQLAEIVDKMVHYNFGGRYESAAEVLADLIQLRGVMPISPASTIITQNQLPWVLPQSKRPLLLGAIVAVLVIGGVAFFLPDRNRHKYRGFYQRGLEQAQTGDPRGAIANYNQAIRFNPADAQLYYKRANANYDLGELDAAITDYSKAIELNPNYGDAYYNRGLAKYDQGNQRGAIEDLNQTIRLSANDSQAYYKRAIAYFDLKDYETAIKDYSEAIRLSPADAKAYLGRGLARSAAGDKQGAIEDYTQALQRDSRDADTYYSRGRARFFLADYGGALEDYTEAIRYNPKHFQAYSNRCGTYLNLGQYRPAVADCSRAISLNPNDAVGYDNRCIGYLNLRDYQKAIQDCTQALRINPNNTKAYSNRGLARSYSGDKQGAIEDYSQAITINPSDAVAYSNRALAHFESNDYTNAISDYAQAIRIDASFAAAYAGRGQARAQLGDKAGALEDLQKAASLYLEQGRPSGYKEIQQLLNKLKQ